MENFVYTIHDFLREKGKESWFVFDVEIHNHMLYQSHGILYFNISNLKDELIFPIWRHQWGIRNVHESSISIEACVLLLILM